MNIQVEKNQNGAIIKLSENIIGIPDDSEFNNAIQKLITENITNIVVDFGNISYVNSTGIGIILRGYQKVKDSGGEIKLASINYKMRSLLEITKLDTIFKIYDTPEEALLAIE